MAIRISERELEELGFSRAGVITPTDDGLGCRLVLTPDVRGCTVYLHVVGDQPMKFGSTQTSLKARMGHNASRIRSVLKLQDPQPLRPAKWHTKKFDKFKVQAAAVIREGRSIEIWAVRPGSVPECEAIEDKLNVLYDTLTYGWATKSHLPACP